MLRAYSSKAMCAYPVRRGFGNSLDGPAPHLDNHHGRRFLHKVSRECRGRVARRPEGSRRRQPQSERVSSTKRPTPPGRANRGGGNFSWTAADPMEDRPWEPSELSALNAASRSRRQTVRPRSGAAAAGLYSGFRNRRLNPKSSLALSDLPPANRPRKKYLTRSKSRTSRSRSRGWSAVLGALKSAAHTR
jgi:hypothetical protein